MQAVTIPYFPLWGRGRRRRREGAAAAAGRDVAGGEEGETPRRGGAAAAAKKGRPRGGEGCGGRRKGGDPAAGRDVAGGERGKNPAAGRGGGGGENGGRGVGGGLAVVGRLCTFAAAGGGNSAALAVVMALEDDLLTLALAGVRDLYGVTLDRSVLSVQATRPDVAGHLTIVVFPVVRYSHLSPAATAQALGDYLVAHSGAVARYEVVQGFLNLFLSASTWLSLLNAITSAEHYGEERTDSPSAPLVMVEYSSPNTNKPLHLGHIRNNLLGWALCQLLAATGNRVVKTNIVNDRGIHICKSMLAWQKFGNGATPSSTGMKGDHFVGDYYVAFEQHLRAEVAALVAQGMDEETAQREAPLMQEARAMLRRWEQNDETVRTLWRQMNEWVYEGFAATYQLLGVSFDKIYYESETYLEGREKVIEGLEKGLFARHDDGSVWADLRGEGLDEKLLLRSDGTSVYMTQDIGTATLRYADYPIDKMIYVVGNEQNYHFQVLALLLDKLGFAWGKALVHYSYGMVELPHGRMKSREGTVVDADDLIAEMIRTARAVSDAARKSAAMSEEERDEVARIVGLGALKYYILKVDARKNMLFNPEESIDFTGNTGPFIQYTYARIRSVVRRAEEQGLSASALLDDSYSPSEREIALIQKVREYAVAVASAAADYAPSVVANYCYELTKSFNQFYHDYSILNADTPEERQFRLVLAANVAKIIRQGMALLGIEVPEKM